MQNISYQKWIFLLSIVLIVLGSIGAVTYAQVTGGDGYISEDENTIRAVDFRTATGTVPAGVEFETQVVIANYGASAKTVDLEAQVYNVDNNGQVTGVVADEVVNITPVEEYTATIDAGEHRRYNYLVRFSEGEVAPDATYAIRITGTPPVNTNNLPPTQKYVNISGAGSTFDGSKFIDRDKIDTEFINFGKFKDENSKDSTVPGSTTDIPPVETDDQNQITESVEAGEGTVESFQDIVSNEDISGSIQPNTPNLNIGFSTDVDDSSEHYGLRVSYTTDSSLNMDKIELRIEDGLGDEVDKNTTYRLSSVNSDVPEPQIIHLSSKEVDYIQNQNSVNLVFNSDDSGSGNINLYDLRVVSSNDIFNLPEPELNAFDMSVSPSNNAQVGDRVRISAKIENTGSAVAYQDFRLYEDKVLEDAIKISNRRVVNPDGTIELTYTYEIQRTGEHQFRLLDETVGLTVEGSDIFGINPTISKSPVRATTNQDVDFVMNVDNDVESKVDSNVKEVRWSFGDSSTTDETISNPSSSSDTSVTKTYTTEGSKKVFMEYDYEKDGREETFSRSTTIDVIGAPNPNITAYYSDFGTISSGTSISSLSSASGIMSATSCKVECDGNFVLFEDYPVTDGISMLVIDRGLERGSYEQVFYGSYEVGKIDGNYSTTSTVNSDNLDDLANDLNSGTSGNPSQQLLNDIQSYRSGGNEDRIFIFTSAGNPKPADLESDIYSELGSLGASLDGGHTGSLTLQENSIWFFASQQTSSGSVPLFERYVPPNVDNPTLTEQVELRDVDVPQSGTIPADRKVYMSAENTELAGTIEDATISWDDRGDGTQDSGLRTGLTYSSQGTKQVEVTVEDVVGNEGTETFEYNVGFRNPTADISSSDLVIGQENFIDSTGSFDNDGYIDSYVWQINGQDTLTGQNPSYNWNRIGNNEVQLTVTDRNGNTDTITESVQVSPDSPEPSVNINRLPASYDTRVDTPYYIKEEPITHHPLNQISNQFSPDIWGGYSGNFGSGIQAVDGVTNGAADFSDTGDVVSIPHTNEFNTSDLTISAWIKPSSVSGESSVISKENVFDLRISDGNLRYDVIGSTSYQASGSQISEGEWNHIAVSYDSSNNIRFYINGTLVERLSTSASLSSSTNPLRIGNNPQGQPYDGSVDSLRMYDKSLDDVDVLSIYSRDASLQSSSIQNVFYQFGEERYDVQISEGSGDIRSDSVVLSTNSISGSDDVSSLRTQNIDAENYEDIKISYNFETQREETLGNPTTGQVSIEVDGKVANKKVTGYRTGSRSGIMSLDVSTLDSESSIKVSSKTFGSNKGQSNLRVFEIWGESSGSNDLNRKPTRYFSSGIYPSVSSNLEYIPSRQGILTVSNALPQGDIAEIDIRNSNEQSLQNHQVKLNIQHQNGMSNDFSDIKFFDQNDVEVDHWVESYSTGSLATVWVEIPSIESNSVETLTMLYDSPQYSDTSDGEATFEHFDGFNTDSSTKWSESTIESAGTGDRFIWDSSRSRLTTDTTGSQWYALYEETKFDDSLSSDGFVAETRVRNEGSNAVGVALETESNTDYDPYVSAASSGFEASQATLDESLIGYTLGEWRGLNNYGSVVGSGGSIPNYHTVGLLYDGDSTLSSSYDGSIQTTTYTETGIDVKGVGLASMKNLQSAYYDWFIVRKYADNQPTVVDKRYLNSRDTSSGISVSDLSSSGGDIRFRYNTEVYNNTVAGTNLFSSNSYDLGTSFESTSSVYCVGISTNPSCSDNGNNEDSVHLTSSGTLGIASEASSTGLQTVKEFEAVAQQGEEYSTVLLNATPSTASGQDNRIVEYEWDTDGGSFDVDKVGEEIQLNLSDGASREVELRVTDETGAKNKTKVQIPVNNAEPQNMDVSAPSTAKVGEEVFISSRFDDDNKKQVAYLFDTGERIVANPGESVKKAFTTDGRIKIMAVGVDEYGQTVSGSTTIDVQSDPPDLSGLEDSITTNVRDTVVFDGTGSITDIEGVSESITTIYNASNISKTSGESFSYRYVLPNGDVKEGEVVDFIPQVKTGPENSREIEMYVTNSVGQTSKKIIDLHTVNQGPKIDEIKINKNYDKESQVFIQSSTCDSQGYCGSKIEYNGFDVSNGKTNDGNKGINMLVLNRNNQPEFFGAYSTDDGDSYSTVTKFNSDGTPVNVNTQSCTNTGCATTNLTSDISKYKDENNVRLVLVGEGQPMPNDGQGGTEVTAEEGELYDEIVSLGGSLNSSGSGPGLVTDSYEVDFQGGTQGWKSDTGTLSQKADDWVAPLCSPSKTSTIKNTDLIDVGQNSIENSVEYSARVAAIDGWNNEELVLELRYDGSWNEVGRENPVSETQALADEGETYDNPSASGLACPEYSNSFASEDGPVDVIEFSGEITVNGKVTGARLNMDDSVAGGIQKDYLESFAIDYLRLNQKDYKGIGLEKNDMWMLHTENNRDGEIVNTTELWEPRGDESGISDITETISMSRERTVDRDKLNVSVESYVPHPRIGGDSIAQGQDGTSYSDTILDSDDDGHTYTFNHTINLSATSVNSLPANYTINATTIDDYSDEVEKSIGISVGASRPNAEIVANKYSVLQGEQFKLNGSTSTDPQNSDLTYQWNLGDGTTATGVTTTKSYSGAVGNRTVSLTVTNEFGQSNTEDVEIAVVDEPTVNLEIVEEDAQTATARLDADATAYGDNNSIETYRFYPGDGTGPIETSDPEYIRNYSTGGIITAEVEVVDKYGQVGSATDSRLIGVPVSCKVINQYISQSSGTYTIDPDRDGDNFDAYCDMDFSGGGWTAIDAPTAREFIQDIGGGIEVAVGSAQTGYVDDGFGTNQQIYPYSVDAGGAHGMKYIIQTDFEFDELHMNSWKFGHGSYIRDNGDTSEVRGSNTLTGDWQGFNSGGVSGDVGFGTRTEVANSWSNEFGGMSNYRTGCPSCSRTFSDGGQIYNVGKTSTAALGWGESGGQNEGWVWKGGEMYVR